MTTIIIKTTIFDHAILEGTVKHLKSGMIELSKIKKGKYTDFIKTKKKFWIIPYETLEAGYTEFTKQEILTINKQKIVLDSSKVTLIESD